MESLLKTEFIDKNIKNSQVLSLEKDIIVFQESYKITELIKLCDESSKEMSIEAQYMTCKIFSLWFASGKFSRPKKVSTDSQEISKYTWIREKYVDFFIKLLDKLSSDELEQQSHSFTLLLRLIHDESCENRGFVNDQYFRVLKCLLLNKNAHIFFLYYIIKEYLDKYVDLQYYFYKNSYKLTKEILNHKHENSSPVEVFTTNLITLLVNMKTLLLDDKMCWVSRSDSLVQSFQSSKQKRVFSDCWITALRLPLKNHQYKQILDILHSNVLPFLQEPHLLMDFLTDSYNAGGPVSLLALNGLFYLMQEYNLDYPNFFIKLYALFDENLFHIRYRSRFIKLKMSRLSLLANPGGIIMIIPLVYNLLKLHPTCMVLIHKISTESPFKDPFLDDELDPSKTKALDSSLWELATLIDHYYPTVSTLARIFSEQFTKLSYDLDDFFDYSYTNIIDLEMNSKLTKPPVIEYQSANGTFSEKKRDNCIFTSLWDLSDISV
ncbi:hypothetical protein PCANB_002899 [Pneumocystis canis]|nr:hypothetical protein PCANB_002899 [Pneumocystis canis]